MITRTFQKLLVVLASLLFNMVCHAAKLPTDLHTQLLYVAPGYSVYTAHGHCALRMQCPSLHLDYCFTYGLDDNSQSYLKFLSGKGLGNYSVVYTKDYLDDYKKHNRKVLAYNLNLNLSEQRNLWAFLDNEISTPPYRRYDYLRSNCSSMCVYAVESILDNEHIEYSNLPAVLNGTYREYIRHISIHKPWIFFIWTTVLGADGEEKGTLEDKLSPSLLVQAWRDASFIDTTGAFRPVFVGSSQLLVKGDDGSRETFLTPCLVFSVLLLLILTLCIVSIKARHYGLAKAVESVILVSQTVAGLFLCYMTFISQLPGTSGNLYVLAFNPLPAVIWLLFRRKEWYGRCVFLYAVFLIILITATPFVPPFDFEHALLESSMLIVCVEAFLRLSNKRQLILPK